MASEKTEKTKDQRAKNCIAIATNIFTILARKGKTGIQKKTQIMRHNICVN